MVALADVFRRFAEDYLSAHGASVLPSHRRAIADILACRTHALGGHLWRCNHCSTEVYSYHSCKNRSCPRCHKDQTERWIAARKAELLECPYFHVTVTVPAELREMLRANQRDGYAALMKATAEAIIELARDRRHVGGTVGVMAVLHTWTQQLVYHPHVHCLVTGGGVSDDGRDWHPARGKFLVPTRPLALLVRAKMRAALEKRRPDLVLPQAAWRKPWVIHCTAWGHGAEAVLRYLARYVFRVAITERRIVGLDDAGVTVRHKHRKSRRWCTTHSAVMSSCAASSSTCYRRGCTRCATRGSGIQAGAIMQPAPARRWRSIPRQSQGRSKTPPTPLCQASLVAPHRRAQRHASVRAARPATSSMCASSTLDRCVDHEPLGDCQRLRLRVPAAPRLAMADQLPPLAALVPMRRSGSSIMGRNRHAPHHRATGQRRAPHLTATTSPIPRPENP